MSSPISSTSLFSPKIRELSAAPRIPKLLPHEVVQKPATGFALNRNTKKKTTTKTTKNLYHHRRQRKPIIASSSSYYHEALLSSSRRQLNDKKMARKHILGGDNTWMRRHVNETKKGYEKRPKPHSLVSSTLGFDKVSNDSIARRSVALKPVIKVHRHQSKDGGRGMKSGDGGKHINIINKKSPPKRRRALIKRQNTTTTKAKMRQKRKRSDRDEDDDASVTKMVEETTSLIVTKNTNDAECMMSGDGTRKSVANEDQINEEIPSPKRRRRRRDDVVAPLVFRRDANGNFRAVML